MNLKSLSNEELDRNLMTWVKAEKKALNNVLSHIAEVDRRKMYLDYAYSGLRAYLEKRMGYDGGSAQRRIDAARLSQSVPSVLESLHEGELKLAQITILQKSLREAKDKNFSKETKSELVEAIKNKSVHETQVIVAKALNIEIKQSTKITYQADESVRFETSLSKSQWENVKTMQELLSNTVPNGDWAEILNYLAIKVKEQKLGKEKTKTEKTSMEASNATSASHEHQGSETTTYEKQMTQSSLSLKDRFGQKQKQKQTTEKQSLYVLKKEVLKRDGCCQFKSKDGKMCGSRWGLEADHIQPKWAGGEDRLENLRALCGNHNRHVYRKQAVISFP